MPANVPTAVQARLQMDVSGAEPSQVLQHAGLVPALVKLIEAHNTKNFKKHSCEEFICDMNKESCEIEELQGDCVGKEVSVR